MVDKNNQKVIAAASPNQPLLEVQTKLDTTLFNCDVESHIKLDESSCANCKERPCLNACPANLFSLTDDGTEMMYSHEGCLECGTCYLICPHLTWNYPRGGYGVMYRQT